MSDPTIDRVRRALGRHESLRNPPTPPEIPQAIARLAPRDTNLPDLFVKSATAANCSVEVVAAGKLPSHVVDCLKLHQCHQIGLSATPLLDRLGIESAIRAANLNAFRWDQTTLDAAYDLDCGITDVYAAVAETGSLVIRPDPSHGRALSLVPPIHVAIVDPALIIPDLLDLMEKISRDGVPPNATLITGPSKTADIEGSLVTGVHGPGFVQIFLLDG